MKFSSTQFVLFCLFGVTFSLLQPLLADDPNTAAHWVQVYEKLLKDRSDIKSKVDRGAATKEEVIQWLKDGGDRQTKRGKRYPKNKLLVKNPSEFTKQVDNEVFSGPQAGERLPAFRVTGLWGNQRGIEYDPVALADGKPVVLIFQDNSVVGQKGLLLTGPALQTIAEKSKHGLQVFATFLVDDPTPKTIFEYDFRKEIADTITMGVSTDGRDGPGVYGLNRNVAMTILVARDGVVLHNFAFTQPMLYPDPYVLGAIAEAIEEPLETVAAWLAKEAATYE